MKYFFNITRRCFTQGILWLLAATGVIGLAGCGSLPSSGPSISMIEAGASTKESGPQYVLVPVTQKVLTTMGWRQEADLPELHFGASATPAFIPFGPSAPSEAKQTALSDGQKIQPGDLVGVSIYTSGGGLFGSPENSGGGTETSDINSATSLPPQLVDSTGAITVPHAGRIPVAGLATYQVEDEITKALAGKAVTPSVIVTIQDRRGSDLVTVTGDVNYPRRVAVPVAGLRILDAVASAGGSMGKDYETKVTVMRGLNIHTDKYSDVVADPTKNIYLQAGDTVVAKSKPWSYTTLGATGQTLHLFPSEQVSAEEALSAVSGLDNSKANPEAVFIYRFESPDRLKSLGFGNGPLTASGVPVIYQINLRQPTGFFMAKQFAMRDKDVIFVGDAGTVGVIKVMNIVGTLTSPAVAGLSATAGISTLH